MKKNILFTAAIVLSLTAAFPSYAGTWLLGQEGDSVRWWYDNGDGTRAASEWRWIDGDGNGTAECYCFDADGWLLTNTITPDFYTVDANGAWTVDGIVQTQSTVLTPSQDQTQQATGWELTDNNEWKYFTSGKYLTSQWRKINGKRYYFDENSIMVTGFQEIDGDQYYFTASGALKTKDFTLDGTRYIVEDDGIITDEYDTDDWDDDQDDDSSSSKKSSGSSSKPFSSSSDDSSDSSSSGGPSSETSKSSGSSYQKPDDFDYHTGTPDSDYRQSSADKYTFTEDE